MDDILHKSEFLNRLRGEKRRADRSNLPLSIALLSFDKEVVNDHQRIEGLMNLVHKNTRDTDIKGWIDHDVIGLILPDTNEKGVQRCVEKILHSNGNIPYSVTTGTYPDDLFNKLLNEERSQPNLFPLDLDDSVKPRKFQDVLKRVMDIIGAIVGLLLFSPFMLVTAIAIKADSPGPIIFKQLRIGRKGNRFSFYKFRSMYFNGDDHLHREYVTNLIKGDLKEINQGDEEAPLYKIKSDPRVTPVGKIIRKTSIDELPQFFNVLKGEMSLVGPRPPLPYEVEKYETWHLRRILEVKPGITGLWQVDGRSTTSFDDMVRLDVRYARNWSLWLDAKILLKTVRAVIHSKGAL